jgi:hypothetical protein
MEVPAAIPVTTPVDGLMAATDGLAIDHVPPAGVEISVLDAPWHTGVLPVMLAGVALAVNTADTKHPVTGTVYRTIALPAVSAETTPVAEPTATIPGDKLVHVPPATAWVTIAALPVQAAKVPVIGAGSGNTVTIRVV